MKGGSRNSKSMKKRTDKVLMLEVLEEVWKRFDENCERCQKVTDRIEWMMKFPFLALFLYSISIVQILIDRM